VAFRPDSRRLATASYDGAVIIWDTGDPARLRPLGTLKHRRLVNAAAWRPGSGSLIATASADKTVVVWDADEAGIVSVLARHTDDVNSVAWLPDGRRLACVSEDGRASLWDAMTGTLLGSPVSHAAHCMMVAASRHGLLATVGEDGMVAVLDPGSRSGSSARRTRSYASSVEGCAWSNSGELLAVTRDDGRVDLLDRELSTVWSVAVSASAARCVAWSADDRSLVVGAYDGAVHFLRADGIRLGSFRDDRLWPRSIAIGRGMVAVGSFGSTPYLLDERLRTPRAEPAAPTHGPNAMTTCDGDLIVGCDSGTVIRLDAGSLPDAPGPHRATRVTPGPILALDSAGGEVAVGTYSGRLGRMGCRGTAAFGETVQAPIPSVVCLPEGIVGGTYHGDLVLADRRSLLTRRLGRAHEGSIKGLARIGRNSFVSAATDRTVAIGTLTERTTLWEHGNLVNSVAVLGDTVVASASRDHTVRIGRLAPDRLAPDRAKVACQQTLLGPDESVKCVGILGTPEEPFVLAGSYDFGLYAWRVSWDRPSADLRDGTVIAEFGQGLSCMCRIDSRTMAVAGWDGRIAIVSLAAGGPPEVRSFSVHDLLARGSEESEESEIPGRTL
jgi:WD40 repeat protein